MERGEKPTLLSPCSRSKNISWDLEYSGGKNKQAQPEQNTKQTGTLKAAVGITENLQNGEENVSGTGPPGELCTCPLPQVSRSETFRALQGTAFPWIPQPLSSPLEALCRQHTLS